MKKILIVMLILISNLFTPVNAQGLTSREVTYCPGFVKKENSGNSLMTGFHLKSMPYLQYAKVASELGFKESKETGDVGTVIWVKNEIEKNVGKNSDNKLLVCIASYGDLFKKYGNMYGVDPNLLAVIAAQEGLCEDLGNVSEGVANNPPSNGENTGE